MLLQPISLLFACFLFFSLLLCIASGLSHVCNFIQQNHKRSRRIGLTLLKTAISLELLLHLTDSVPLKPFLPNILSYLAHHLILSRPEWPSHSVERGRIDRPHASSTLGRIRKALREHLVWILSFLLPLASHFLVTSHYKQEKLEFERKGEKLVESLTLPGGRLNWDYDWQVSSAADGTNRGSRSDEEVFKRMAQDVIRGHLQAGDARLPIRLLELVALTFTTVWLTPLWLFLGSCSVEFFLPLTNEGGGDGRGLKDQGPGALGAGFGIDEDGSVGLGTLRSGMLEHDHQDVNAGSMRNRSRG
ncbi:hypothetical protein IE53DRAFT_377466 [Violaceomyces palustris]|uniref:Uncharacterized protein n=1 Tax=Violaceomyces palustris TaxID=1673888 RepID=A0ACD0P5D8_9BASI|nr:hypothetical protein IE53DRAFT_377466 [Violaceomyces palustris]